VIRVILWGIAVAALYSCGRGRVEEDGIKTIYYPGTKIVHQKISYKDGFRNGWFIEYARNGLLKARVFYRNDSLDDTSYIYHRNGRLRSLHVYKGKRRHGCWREFNPEGKMYSEMFFFEGKFDSICSEYSYKSLKLLKRIQYRKGVKHGLDETYYPDGSPQSVVKYCEGRVCRGTKEWTRKGKPVDNDFEIQVSERNHLALNNTIRYIFTLGKPQSTDQVFKLMGYQDGDDLGGVTELEKDGEGYYFEATIPKGGNIMEKLTVAAFRRTAMGNLYVKTKTVHLAADNF
jgi:antitoxin component YwqK of YwqJK toxin-antitoxin module